MVFLPPGGPNQGERYEITGPVFPTSPEAQDGLLDLAPGTPAWSTVTPWVYGLPVQGSKPPRTVVTHGGSTFVAVQDDPSGTIVPGTDPATWVCVAAGSFHYGTLAAMNLLDPVANDAAHFVRTDMGTGQQKALFVAMGGAWVQVTAVY